MAVLGGPFDPPWALKKFTGVSTELQRVWQILSHNIQISLLQIASRDIHRTSSWKATYIAALRLCWCPPDWFRELPY